MAYPKWFSEVEYLSEKLGHLQKIGAKDANGSEFTSISQVADALKAAGTDPYSHYNAYGSAEGLSPSVAFNAQEYCEFKLRLLQTDEATKSEWAGKNWQDVQYGINKAGMSLGQHYTQYGAVEGVSMSNAFDTNVYLTAKLDLLKATDKTWEGKTVKELATAFKELGLDPYTHYMTFKGTSDQEVPTSFDVSSKDPVHGGGGNGKTYTLTSGADVFTATAPATFVADSVGGTGTEVTLNASDVLTGSSGKDTLKLYGVAGNVNNFGNATISSIEVVENYTSTALDVSGNKDVQEAWSMGKGGNVTATMAQKVGFSGATGGTVTFKDASASTTDAGSLLVKNAGTAATAASITSASAIETLNIAATGTNNITYIDSGNSLDTVIFTGNGAVSAELVSGAAFKLIDASAATGAVEVTVDADDLATTKFEMKGGTTDKDSLTLNGVTAKQTLAKAQLNVSGVETLVLDDDTMGFKSLDLSNVSGLKTLAVRTGGADAGGLTLNAFDAATALAYQGDGKSAIAGNVALGAVTAKVKGASASNLAAVTVDINNQGHALNDNPTSANPKGEYGFTGGSFDAANVKSLTINAADADVTNFTITGAQLQDLKVTATEDFKLGTTFGNAGLLTTVDFAGVKGDAAISFNDGNTKGITYTGAEGKDTVTIGTLPGDTSKGIVYSFSTGTGDDSVSLTKALGVTADAKLNIDLGEGNDTLSINATATIAGTKSATIDFGAGTDTLKVTGDTSLQGATVTGLEKIELSGDLTVNSTFFDAANNSISNVTFLVDKDLIVSMGNNESVDLSVVNGNVSGATGNIGFKVNAGADANVTLTDYADVFAFSATKVGSTAGDISVVKDSVGKSEIVAFDAAADAFNLNQAVFGAFGSLGNGATLVDGTSFKSVANAGADVNVNFSTNGGIVYNQATGEVWYVKVDMSTATTATNTLGELTDGTHGTVIGVLGEPSGSITAADFISIV